MTLNEFKKSVYYTEKMIVIPILGRMRINKVQFMKQGKWIPELLNIYLYELYENNYNKIKNK